MGVIERVIAVAEFEGAAREAVHALKYQNRHAISGLMGRLMADAAAEAGGSLVVHVALHSSRRRERGYDQAAMLSRHLAQASSLPFEAKALVRVRKTLDQVQLALAERKLNLENAFKCEARLHGENVLLVDDVYTTGSTLTAAAQALRESGAGEIIGLVFARAEAGADRRRQQRAHGRLHEAPGMTASSVEMPSTGI
jgi:ComF family protein